jgi:hypothetical protein
MEHYNEERRSRFGRARERAAQHTGERAAEGLERAGERGFLSAVTSPPLPSQHESAAPLSERGPGPEDGERRWAIVRCGLFVAAATAGVITGFSLRGPEGPLAPFATSGRMLLGVTANEGRVAQLLALGGGIALHVLLAVVWTSLFALLARALRARRGLRLWLAAALFTVGAYGTSEYLLAPLLRLGHAARPYPPQLALLYAVFAVALVVGMRLANSGVGGTATSGSPGA